MLSEYKVDFIRDIQKGKCASELKIIYEKHFLNLTVDSLDIFKNKRCNVTPLVKNSEYPLLILLTVLTI